MIILSWLFENSFFKFNCTSANDSLLKTILNIFVFITREKIQRFLNNLSCEAEPQNYNYIVLIKYYLSSIVALIVLHDQSLNILHNKSTPSQSKINIYRYTLSVGNPVEIKDSTIFLEEFAETASCLPNRYTNPELLNKELDSTIEKLNVNSKARKLIEEYYYNLTLENTFDISNDQKVIIPLGNGKLEMSHQEMIATYQTIIIDIPYLKWMVRCYKESLASNKCQARNN
jgi:hypothetical protein